MNRRRAIRVPGFAFALALPAVAWANAGVPMLMLAWPVYIVGLVPIVAIESFIGTKDLDLSWREALPVVAIGNLWSTLLGIPLTWAAMLAVEMFVGVGLGSLAPDSDMQKWLFPFFVAWLPPFDNVWPYYAAFVILSVPFCLVSIWIEGKVAVRKLSTHSPAAVRAWVRHANIWSYTAMVVCAIAFPAMRH